MEPIEQKINFLVVEDMVSDSFLLQRQLKKICTNPEIRFVDDKLALVNALKVYIPDFVLCDFSLKGFDAFDVIQILHDYNPSIPVIIITGNLKNEDNRAKLLENGASGFFLKDPIDTLHERLHPVFVSLLTDNQEAFEDLSKKRKDMDSYKKSADFFRQHEMASDRDDNEEEVSGKSRFWEALKNLFK